MFYADHKCTYREERIKGEHVYIFTGPCIVTGEMYSVTVPGPGLYKYRQGMHIQDAMPEVSEEDCEFLITGHSPKGWEIVFSKEER